MLAPNTTLVEDLTHTDTDTQFIYVIIKYRESLSVEATTQVTYVFQPYGFYNKLVNYF